MEPPVQETTENWQRKIDVIEESGIELSQWEAGFIDSLSVRLSDEQLLTFRQSKKLREICERVG